MLRPEALHAINTIAKVARQSTSPMGGLQVIITGDFLQLPPVNKGQCGREQDYRTASTTTTTTTITSNVNNADDKKIEFCFQAPAWKENIQKTFLLSKVFRQSEIEFVRLLDNIRFGRSTADVLRGFDSCVKRQLDCEDGIKPTQIFTLKHLAENLNKRELEKLPGEGKY